jgi:hypothetical protein
MEVASITLLAALTSAGCWVIPKAFVDTVAKRKIFVSADNQTPVIEPVANHLLTEILCTNI